MIKAKQKSIRIFDISIEREEEFFPYMDKNLILLKEFLLILHGDVTKKIKKYLEENGICFVLANECNLKFKTKSNDSKKDDIIGKANISEPFVETENNKSSNSDRLVKTLVLQKPVRSGEEIIHNGDITIFSRVNSASKVISDGNIEIYGKIDGLIQCDGDYMIVKELGNGHIIFNGDILDKELFDGKLKKITRAENGFLVENIF